MRYLQLAALIVIGMTVFAGNADAQRKSKRKPLPKKEIKYAPPLEVRAAREKVDTQMANVSRFIDVLGPIAQGIEEIDVAGKTKPLPKATTDKNEANKQKVIEAIRNLKVGLANLETEFRTTPALGKYLPNIEGITDLANQAEDTAIAGRFVAAKDPLRDVLKRLRDTLAVMPI